MELKLDLPISALAAPITEIMNTLTEDQKVAVAVQVVMGVLNNPNADAEFMGLDAKAIAYVRQENRYRDLTDNQCREHADYTKFSNMYASGPRTKILQSMVVAGNQAMKEAITKAVLEAPVTQATIKVVSDHIVTQIPALIAQAQMLHFAGNLDRAVTTEVMSRAMPAGRDPNGNEQHVLTAVELHKRVSAVVAQAATESGNPKLAGG